MDIKALVSLSTKLPRPGVRPKLTVREQRENWSPSEISETLFF